MNIVLMPVSLISIIAICMMIGILIISQIKKIMMTYSIIIANFFTFIITMIFYEEIIFGYSNGIFQYAGLAFRPIYLSIEFSPQLYTLFTSIFIHSGPMHFIGNMFIFFFIGTAFEQRIGWKKFTIIYILGGFCGTLTHSLLNLQSVIPLVGASGAIFAIMGAFAFAYPKDEVVMPVPIGILMVIRRVKVIYAVLLFAALETIVVILEVQDTTAHFAHLGGLIGGVILAVFLIRGKETHTELGKTIYYDSYSKQKPIEIDLSRLKKFVNTPELDEIFRKIENETVPQVRETWIEHFIKKSTCPRCKNQLNYFDKKIWCDKCGYKTNY